MTTIATPTETPKIICPPWCVVSYEEHVAELPEWDGFVIHKSTKNQDAVAWHSRVAFIDGTPDPTEEPLVFVDDNDGMSIDEAEQLARTILAAVEEARA